MKKSLYILPIALLFGAVSASAQTQKPSDPSSSQPGTRSQSGSAKDAPMITSASAVKTAKDDQKVQLRGKIVSKQSGNDYMVADSTGQVLVEIGSRAVKGDNKQLAAGTEVEIQGEVDTRRGKEPKVEAKQVTVLAGAGSGASKSGSPSGSPSSPQRSQSPSGSSSGK